jgi:uncharacterized protein
VQCKSINWANQSFVLSTEKLVFWEEEKTIILSDTHLGKVGHFRKEGIAIPQQAAKVELYRLVSVIQFFNPQKIIVVGDLFHSHFNLEVELFAEWKKCFNHIEFILVKGNHDILASTVYERLGINVVKENLNIKNIQFTHHINTNEVDVNTHYVHGHIHPGFHFKAKDRMGLTLPCFHFTKNILALPAFGAFTGLYKINPGKNDKVFAIADGELFHM